MSFGETGEPPSVAEGLRSATFLGRVSWKQSRCQLSKDPKGSAKECGPRLEALGRHKAFPGREQPDHIWAVRGSQAWGGFTKQYCREEESGRRQTLRPSAVSSRWESPEAHRTKAKGGSRKKETEGKGSERKVEAEQSVVPGLV